MEPKNKRKKKKDPRGGPRKNSGRKSTEDKKLPITLYVETSKIDKLGGKPEIQKLCYQSINDKNSGFAAGSGGE